MQRKNSVFFGFCAAVTMAGALSCVTGKSEEAAPKVRDPAAPIPPPAAAARNNEAIKKPLAPALANELAKRFASAPANVEAAFALYSDGGWSNAGQVMVLFGNDAKSTQVLIVPPNKHKIEIERAATETEWQAIAAAAKRAAPLLTIDQKAFDAAVFEYQALKRGEAGPELTAHWFFCNPSGKPAPDHNAVIQALQDLRPKAKAPKK